VDPEMSSKLPLMENTSSQSVVANGSK